MTKKEERLIIQADVTLQKSVHVCMCFSTYILDGYWQDYNTDLIACILIADREISCSTCFHYLPRIHSGTSVPLLCQCQGFSQLPRRQQVCMYAHMYEITFIQVHKLESRTY